MAVYSLGRLAPRLPGAGRFWTAPTAAVIGQVEVGVDVSVWFGAVVRGNSELISLGDRTNVQDNAVLHADPGFPLIIGEDVTVGHQAVLHGCTVGDGVLIGMGAIVLNGAKIGAGSLIGAAALVTEGQEIPPRSLVVGAPAKVVRTLNDSTVEKLSESAHRYVRNWRLFSGELRQIDG